MNELPNDCKNIKEYFLTRVFKGEEATKNDQNHRVAESILHYFSGFDVFSLPIPTYDKELMKDVKGNMDKMNPQFFTGVKQFEELLRSIMGPKRSCKEGEYVTGEGLAALTTLYVEAINDPHNVPNVQTAWETFVNIKCEGAKKKAITAYEKKAKEELSKLPCDDEEILRGNDSATHEMMATFEQETHGISIDHTKPYLEELTKLRFQKLGEWKNENDKKTRESCEKLVKRLRKKHLDPVLQRVSGPEGTNVSFKDIDDGCAVLELEYKSQAVGSKDVRAKVLHEFHQQFQIERERYKDVLKTLKDYNETLLLIRLQNTKAEKEKEDLRKQNDYLKQEMKIQEDKIKELDRKRAIELQEKLEEFQAKESILNTKIHDLEKAGMKDKITGLERERDDAKEDNERWKRELASVKSKLADLTEQLRLLNRPWWQRW
ncbi:Guanylate-binding protein 4 [Stylophora pistillata]|uniref:Guanylate-binding protein 4 n=2 Tax=Stylophora pistillata TaxID=50429 RepID=A0A2B4R4Q7_STYPI|nr:Guanylate-binding protein 4 [Stylophora pistillata]